MKSDFTKYLWTEKGTAIRDIQFHEKIMPITSKANYRRVVSMQTSEAIWRKILLSFRKIKFSQSKHVQKLMEAKSKTWRKQKKFLVSWISIFWESLYFSHGVCIKEIGTLKNDKKENTWIRLELKHFFYSFKYVAVVKQFGPKNYIQLQTNPTQENLGFVKILRIFYVDIFSNSPLLSNQAGRIWMHFSRFPNNVNFTASKIFDDRYDHNNFVLQFCFVYFFVRRTGWAVRARVLENISVEWTTISTKPLSNSNQINHSNFINDLDNIKEKDVNILNTIEAAPKY